MFLNGRTAIVHDALVNAGGAERTVTFMAEAFPDAPIFTAAFLPTHTFPERRDRDVRVLPGAARIRSERDLKRRFFQVAHAFRNLDLSEYDTVLSSTTFGAKHVRPPARVRHACYCYAPFRLLWKPDAYDPSSLPIGVAARAALGLIRPLLRAWDKRASLAPTALATTCRNMAAEIQRCYGRTARVIPVPVRMSRYRLAAGVGDYYLSVSRLMSHKRVDLAVEACCRLNRRLVVVGDGPEMSRLKARADDRISFLGAVSDEKLIDLYAGCRALLFCSDEDYGLAPIEAQASGRPVVALGVGGALETVTAGVSGVFFPTQDVDAVIAAIEELERRRFAPDEIRASVQRFDLPVFIDLIRAFASGSERSSS